MSKPIRSRNWCFTLNNYSQAEEYDIQGIECRYVTYGRETGSMCETPHLQGFICWDSQKTFTSVSKKLGSRCHIEPMKSTLAAAIAYCHKEDPAPYQNGDKPVTPSDKGQACKDLFKGVWLAAKEGRLDDIPEKLRIVHIRNIEHIREKYGASKPVCPEIELKDWQVELCDKLAGEPDPRKILIYVDHKGGAGKTTLSKYLINKFDGVEMYSSAASKDIACAVVCPKIALFDFARCNDNIPWNAVEKVKDGIVFSSKYESHNKFFPTPHVVCFMNADLYVGKLSEDRLDVTTLSSPSASSSSWIK